VPGSVWPRYKGEEEGVEDENGRGEAGGVEGEAVNDSTESSWGSGREAEDAVRQDVVRRGKVACSCRGTPGAECERRAGIAKGEPWSERIVAGMLLAGTGRIWHGFLVPRQK
jgi:hypothetical protein